MSAPSLFSRTASRALSFLPRSGGPLTFKRAHSVPALPHDERLVTGGIPGLFSERTFKTSWTTYQRHLIDNLNRLTDGTGYANMSPLDIAVTTSRQADLAATFNYASQAHNNHFFFSTLSAEGTIEPVKMPEIFLKYIPYGFSSPEEFKAEMLTTANAMFGSGWVWLVLDSNQYLRIMCTYNAGTPYGRLHRRQDMDMNTQQRLGDNAKELTEATRAALHRSMVRSWAAPVMNIKVFEHAWVEDFGVDGKQKYLEAVWDAIDWNVVASRCPVRDQDSAFAQRPWKLI